MNSHRCVLISGPPGIGKTTSAHLVAKLLGYDVLELNASDTRSKKMLEEAFRSKTTDTTLAGFVKKEGDEVRARASPRDFSLCRVRALGQHVTRH